MTTVTATNRCNTRRTEYSNWDEITYRLDSD